MRKKVWGLFGNFQTFSYLCIIKLKNNKIMTTLKDVLFKEGNYNEKKSFIDDMSVDALMDIPKSLVKIIIEKAGNGAGRMYLNREFRKGNAWNSEIEEVVISNGDVLVFVYVQNTKTDTTTTEYFDKFFRRGEYCSRNNNLNESVDYTEGQKAEVMQSILLQCIYNLFSGEHKKEVEIAKLKHYTIINPVVNHFYREYDLGHKRISQYSSRDTVAEIKGYHFAESELTKYIENNYTKLIGKSNEELQEIYKDVFQKKMDEFKKIFDYEQWRKETYLWY